MSNPNFLTANTAGIELMPGINDNAVGYDVNRIVQALNGTNLVPIIIGDLSVIGIADITGAITGHNSIITTGSNAGFQFIDRSSSRGWQWYANGDLARLYNGSADVLNIDTSGDLVLNGYLNVGGATTSQIGGPVVSGQSTAPHIWFPFSDGSVYFDTPQAFYVRTGGGAGAALLTLNSNQDVSINQSAGRLIFGVASSKIIPGATSLSLRNNADSADNLLVDNAGNVTVRAKFTTSSLIAQGGTSFPGSPATNDHYWRTDLGLGFYYDGTRWLSEELFVYPMGPGAFTFIPIAATSLTMRAAVPPQSGGSDIWLVDYTAEIFVQTGGTALGASHKWVGLFRKSDVNAAGTTIVTTNVDSGASGQWREFKTAINALLARSTYFELEDSWTKTGTPGTLFVLQVLTYRIVAT